MPAKKSNWIIKVHKNEFANVLNALKLRKIVLVNTLENISVFVVNTTPKMASDLKGLKGIIVVEPEREVGLY